MAFIFQIPNRSEFQFVGELPTGIKSKKELLTALSDALHFPDYFGGNWDALDECIRDLSWLPRGRVLLIHNEMPMEGTSEILVYLDILVEGQKSWKPDKKRELSVAFPASAETAIREMLAQIQSTADNISEGHSPRNGR